MSMQVCSALQVDEDGGDAMPYLPEVPEGFEASARAPQVRTRRSPL